MSKDDSFRQRAPLLVIAGPTASGKTALAVEVALKTNAELVGADSMQVYRGMDIGTAKPCDEELRGVRHHLIDVAEPNEPFDAARYIEEADQTIAALVGKSRRVIVVGGTGLYIRALLHGLHKGPAPVPEIRERLQKRVRLEGSPALHAELSKRDPKLASRLHPNDRVRIIRALEVVEGSGVPMSEWQSRHGFLKWRYPALLLGIQRSREELNRRINERVEQMMERGFLAEVEELIGAGFGPELKSMQGLGYRHLAAYLAQCHSLDEAVEGIKKDTRRYAKRQMTWFRQEKKLKWVNLDVMNIIAQTEHFWQKPIS